MMNMRRVEASGALRLATGVGAVFSPEAIAELYAATGAEPSRVAKMRIEAAKESIRRDSGGKRRW